MFKRFLFSGVASLLLCGVALAQTPAPTPLKPWEEWASAPFAYRDCAIKPGVEGQTKEEYACQWPGKLDLRLKSDGGTFEQSWTLQHKGGVALPGSAEHWPQQVRVDGVPAAVVERDGAPFVLLPPGRHVVRGQWTWDKPPSRLTVPPQTAWWSVDRPGDGATRREGSELLFEDTQQAPTTATARDTVNLRIFRKFTDAQAVEMEVLVQLNVGGSPRELVLGPVVDPKQWLPVHVESSWPVQWQPDGRLRVQVQPGSSQMSVRMRCIKDCQGPFTRPSAIEPWPAMEYWALESDPSFRIVAWEGDAVDPRQIAAPERWQGLPWISVRNKASAKWVVKSRGPTDKDAAMVLSREGWLDFDGQAWWLKDTVQGPTPRAYRLEALAPYQMVSASMGQHPLLVSEHKGKTGVEWRLPTLSTEVLLRQEGRAPELPIAGVAGEFSQVSWTLHFPAGHQVLFAPGADEAGEVWWTRWRLTQVLGVALLLLLSWRWGGLRALLPASLLILIAYHTPGLPIWSWGFVLGLGLLSQAGLPERLNKPVVVIWYVVLGLWLLLAASFSIHQVKAAMYPQWVQDSSAYGPGGNTSAVLGRMRQNQAIDDKSASMESGAYQTIGNDGPAAPSVADTTLPVLKADSAPAEDPFSEMVPPAPPKPIEETGARISAGPGIPQWRSPNPVTLSWQGPITANDTVKLWVVGPVLVGLGRWLSVAMLLLVGWSLLRRPVAPTGRFPGFKAPWKKAAIASLLLLALPVVAQASSPVPVDPNSPVPNNNSAPSSDWMDRLGQERHPVPECAPKCVSISSAKLSTSGGDLVVEMEAHAQARAALPLPMDADNGLVLQSVQQEGQAVPAVLQEANQQWLQLSKGVSRLRLVYTARAASGTLKFPQNPGRIEAAGSDWTFSGIDKNRVASGVLGWQKTVVATVAKNGEKEKVEVAVAPFVVVNRTLVFGPKWEVQVQVVRMAPAEGAFVVHVPLLDGEQPRQDLPRDDKGSVIVSFQQGQNDVTWTSDLPAKTSLVLMAPPSATAIERWTLQPGARFRVAVEGLPSLSNDAWSFRPLPGEKISISVSEPKPVSGPTVAIDNAQLTQQWGPRGQSIDLVFQTRATTATDLVLIVPPGLDMVSVKRGGGIVPGVKVENGKLLLPAPPGAMGWELVFRNNQSPSLRMETPKFQFDAPLANLTMTHIPGAKRWVLDTQGPGKAPAVAYWPWLVILIVLALVMGRWRHSPLKTWQWVLLGLGFSVAAPWKIALVGGWLVALNQRSLHSKQLHEHPLFNLVQAGLVAWTLIAVATIVGALPESLLASPDMKIYGQMGDRLPWFVDQVKAATAWPQAVVISLPIWVYRLLMLSWSLWLAITALNWLRDGLKSWLLDGHWKAIPRRVPKAPPPPTPPA